MHRLHVGRQVAPESRGPSKDRRSIHRDTGNLTAPVGRQEFAAQDPGHPDLHAAVRLDLLPGLVVGVHHFFWWFWEAVVAELPAGEFCTLRNCETLLIRSERRWRERVAGMGFAETLSQLLDRTQTRARTLECRPSPCSTAGRYNCDTGARPWRS